MDSDVQEDQIKGVTKHLLIRVEGGVAHDSTTFTQVGTADCTLDIILDKHYRYCYDPTDKYKRATEEGSLGTITTAVQTIDDVNEDEPL